MGIGLSKCPAAKHLRAIPHFRLSLAFKPEYHPTLGIQIMQYLQEAVNHFQLDVKLGA